MKCAKCGTLFGNMKDDGVPVNPILGNLCGMCWAEVDEINNPEKWKMLRESTNTGSGLLQDLKK